jgi:hypothetical protein
MPYIGSNSSVILPLNTAGTDTTVYCSSAGAPWALLGRLNREIFLQNGAFSISITKGSMLLQEPGGLALSLS